MEPRNQQDVIDHINDYNHFYIQKLFDFRSRISDQQLRKQFSSHYLFQIQTNSNYFNWKYTNLDRLQREFVKHAQYSLCLQQNQARCPTLDFDVMT